jgi:hypothetical protein
MSAINFDMTFAKLLCFGKKQFEFNWNMKDTIKIVMHAKYMHKLCILLMYIPT